MRVCREREREREICMHRLIWGLGLRIGVLLCIGNNHQDYGPRFLVQL